MSDIRDQLTRRQALGAAAAGTGAVILAGCGSSGSQASGSHTTASSASNTAKPKYGGTFRWGAPDSSTTDSVDPLLGGNSTTSYTMCQCMYDTLTKVAPNSLAAVPLLAEEFTPAKDLTYWDFRLNKAEWHNGKPVTADDVIYTLKRVLNPKTPGTAAAILPSIDPSRLKKLDSRTVRVYLKYPDISLPLGLTDAGASIVPVDFDPKKPIGSGPFKFKSLTPGQRGVFVRNPNYWQSGKPYLDQFEMISFADPNTTRINALVNGQIDTGDYINASLVPTLKNASTINVAEVKASVFITWEMRMDVPPFDDVRVRQAMKLIANRPQMVEQAYSGLGIVANDLMGDWWDPLYDHSIPQRVQDIEQAKSLLKAAGKEGLTVPLTVSPITGGVLEMAQVLQQNAKEAGVTIKIDSITDAAAYNNKYAFPAVFKISYAGAIPIWNVIGYFLLPNSVYGISKWRNPKWLSLVTQARGTLDDAKRKDLMFEAQQIFYNEGTEGVFAFQNATSATSKKFTAANPSLFETLSGVPYYDIYQA
jgi:peptide/nickel transport system substrate-binding protein